jgi:hypothetical protein
MSASLLTEPTRAQNSDDDVPEPTVERLPQLHERLGPGRFPGIRRPFHSLFWAIHLAFGTLCLILLLAILAATPGLNILTLGYLLDPQKRVATSGRLRDGFPLMTLAPRLGIIVFFSLAFLIPVRLLATRVSDAAVILGEQAERVQRLTTVLTVCQWMVAIHLLLAISRGGTVGCFLRPIRNIRWMLATMFTAQGRLEFSQSLDAVVTLIRPLHHFWIGLKGFLGAVLWLIIPTGLLVAYSAPGRTAPGYGLLSFLGVLIMVPVTAWLPMLQVHQAVTGRFSAIFSVSAARRIIRNAPFSWMITTLLIYVMTFPLYLTKIKLLPADAMLVLTPFFILLTYPARVLVAWAYHRGIQAESSAGFFSRWGCRLTMIPLLLAHAVFLFFTPAISELGKNAPLENQAFLGPVPYAQWGRR